MGKLLAFVAALAAFFVLTVGSQAAPEAIDCRVSNWQEWGPTYDPGECGYGTLLTFENEQFRCAQPLSSYGSLPLLLRWEFSGNPNFGDQGHLDFIAGCRGDGDPDTIDVIVESNADGVSVGACGGAGKFRTAGPVDIQITGQFNSGPLCGPAHQDVWQFHPNHTNARLDIVNGVSGNWEAGTATTIGAGGAIFYSNPYDVDVYGGRYVTCNHGLFGNVSSFNEIVGAGFRTGRNDGSDPKCTPYHASNPCPSPAPNFVDLTCQRWQGGRWVNQAGYGDPSPPPPPPVPPPPPPPPPPVPPPPPPPYSPACAPTCDEQIAQLTAERDAARAEVGRLGDIIDRARTVLEEK